jgi:formylglycine-generating enzyme required for sulfatase activity
MPEREYYTAYPRPILWLVPGGEGEVGGVGPGGGSDSAPAFRAEVEPFYLSKLPVTNEQYEAFDPGHERSPVSPGDRDPAVGVSWYDAAEYCAWYAEVARKPIRLPTEIEWEYACRGGGDGDDRASDELAWHRGNSAGGARIPALDAKPTNGFGLHAMLGGVWEWTGSVYRPYPLDGEEPVRDGEPDDVPRVLRGGSCREPLGEITCSVRRAEPPEARFEDAGFRIARSFR